MEPLREGYVIHIQWQRHDVESGGGGGGGGKGDGAFFETIMRTLLGTKKKDSINEFCDVLISECFIEVPP